jgi:hypothetical protein
VHLPEFSLVSCTIGSLSCLERLLVEIEGEIKEIISDLACIDIFFFDLRDRLTDVS